MHIAGNDGEDDNDNDLDLEAGYGSETASVPPRETEAKVEAKPEPVEPDPQQVEAEKPEAVKPKVEAKPKPPAEAPKYRQITEDEWNNLSAAASKATALEKQFSTFAGTVGNLKQVVTKLQAATPSGAPVDTSKAFKKLEAEFPELAAVLRDDMGEMLQGIKGTGGEEPKPSQTITEDELNTRLKASRQKDAEEALEDEFPKWRQIVGEVDTEGKHDPANPYRVWLAKQSADYQSQINSTDNPYLIARSIRRFRKETAAAASPSNTKTTSPAKPSPKQEARQTRIQAAVPLKGAGSPTKPRNNADDDFEAGYASERAG